MPYKLVLDSYYVAPFLNQSAWKATGVENRGEILTRCEKQGGLVEMSIGIFVPHLGSKHRHTFYPLRRSAVSSH